jgi:RepB plasmid partitioning protein/ParB-like nuclease domain
MAPNPATEAVERDVVLLRLENMLVLRDVSASAKRTPKFRRIAQSLGEVGLVEPLVVCGKPDKDGRFLLLDGHLRRAALLDKGQTEARCILALSDEAFTYNVRVNRVATVQEHLMIVRALERGVSEEKLARALNVNVQHVRRRVSLLNGICQRAVGLLADKSVNPVTFDVLRKMKPERQIEACNLMTSASDFSSAYAKALLAGSKSDDLKKAPPARRASGVTIADLTLLEREMARMQSDFTEVEVSYGQDVLVLAITSNYLSKLIANPRVSRYLDGNHPEILAKFRSIAAVASVEEGEGARIACAGGRERRSKAD